MYKTVVITPASVEPVTLAEAKAQLRLEPSFTLDDSYIADLISAARDRVESYCNRFFTQQTVTVLFDENMPVAEMQIPYPNIQSVDSVQYVQDATLTTLPTADYYVDTLRQKITNIGNWPTVDNYRMTLTTSAPLELSGVKQAILMIVTDLYELRAEHVVGASIAVNKAVEMKLYPYRENLGI